MAFLERGFSIRASTALLSLAVGSLGIGLTLIWAAERFSVEGVGTAGMILLMAAFPTLALCSLVASVGYLLRRRRLQHLVETLISAGLVAWLSTWEWP